MAQDGRIAEAPIAQAKRHRELRLGSAVLASALNLHLARTRREGMRCVAIPVHEVEAMRQTTLNLCALSIAIETSKPPPKLATRQLILGLAAEGAGFTLLAIAGGWQLSVGFLLVTFAANLRAKNLQR